MPPRINTRIISHEQIRYRTWGIHATLLEKAMGYACFYSEDPANPRFTITLNLSVNFVGQSKGDTFVVDAKQTVGGRQIYVAEGSETENHGCLIASRTGTFQYRSDQENEKQRN